MENLIITDFNGVDTPSFYTYQSTHNPLVYSSEHNLWVANSYACCKSVLSSEYTQVPNPGIPAGNLLNEKAVLMINNLVRINNDQNHTQARIAAILLYERIKTVDIGVLIDGLLNEVPNKAEFDWVLICKRLPVLAILKGLGFNDEDHDWMVENMYALIKIMSPNKTEPDIKTLNSVINKFYSMSAGYISKHEILAQFLKLEPGLDKQEATDLLICNLLGLFIQSYDACRALLTNTVLTLNRLKTERVNLLHTNAFYQKMITEMLRIDPPVHNTRRIAVQDLEVNGKTIKAGQTILITMAAANMDHMVFSSPEHFDLERGNNDAHLTFGLAGHACIAKYFCINMAVQTCHYLVEKFDGINILHHDIVYEPQLNVKMAKKLMVSL